MIFWPPEYILNYTLWIEYSTQGQTIQVIAVKTHTLIKGPLCRLQPHECPLFTPPFSIMYIAYFQVCTFRFSCFFHAKFNLSCIIWLLQHHYTLIPLLFFSLIFVSSPLLLFFCFCARTSLQFYKRHCSLHSKSRKIAFFCQIGIHSLGPFVFSHCTIKHTTLTDWLQA